MHTLQLADKAHQGVGLPGLLEENFRSESRRVRARSLAQANGENAQSRRVHSDHGQVHPLPVREVDIREFLRTLQNTLRTIPQRKQPTKRYEVRAHNCTIILQQSVTAT